MADSALRELERAWKSSGSVESEAAFLLGQVRAGILAESALELEAYVGVPAARLAWGERPRRSGAGLTHLAWEVIEPWLAVNAPRMLKNLRPGASERMLLKAEKRLGLRFPAGFRAFWKLHNGQRELSPYFFDQFHTFFTLDQILENTEMLVEDEFEIFQGQPERRRWARELKLVYWSPARLPFAQAVDGGGNFLCLDLDPSPKGTAGQVFDLGYPVTDSATLESASFEHLLALYAFAIAQGRYREEDGDLYADAKDYASLATWVRLRLKGSAKAKLAKPPKPPKPLPKPEGRRAAPVVVAEGLVGVFRVEALDETSVVVQRCSEGISYLERRSGPGLSRKKAMGQGSRPGVSPSGSLVAALGPRETGTKIVDARSGKIRTRRQRCCPIVLLREAGSLRCGGRRNWLS